MGFLKGMKDMKQMVEAAPGMIDQAQQMGQQALDGWNARTKTNPAVVFIDFAAGPA